MYSNYDQNWLTGVRKWSIAWDKFEKQISRKDKMVSQEAKEEEQRF